MAYISVQNTNALKENSLDTLLTTVDQIKRLTGIGMEWSGKIQDSMPVEKVKKTTITPVIMHYKEGYIYISK